MNIQKIIFTISKILIIIFIFNIIGLFALTTKNSKAKTFFRFFDDMISGIYSNRNRIIHIDSSDFINNLKSEEMFYSNARFENEQWIIELMKLGSKNVLHRWAINQSFLEDQKSDLKISREFSHSEPRSPLVLKDKSLLMYLDEVNYFFYLDSNSKVIWCNTDYQYHHTFNLHNDTIWTCGRKRLNGVWENYVIGLSKSNGKVIFTKAITSIILKSNNHWLLGCANKSIGYTEDDPYHLNDIEVVAFKSKYWEVGDLFLSLRHRSTIIQYRPKVDSVVRIIQGPFLQQHDVDILDESRISVFNNNVSGISWKNNLLKKNYINIASNICVYDFSSNQFEFPILNSFIDYKIITRTEGLHHIFGNGDIFVERQNQGTVYYFDKSGKLIYYGKLNNRDEHTHWPRIYNSNPIYNKSITENKK
jgi:hypothetical protein